MRPVFPTKLSLEMISRSTLGFAAAGAGICFIGYCIYFDRKRRSDPLFKKKLREKRRKNKEQTTHPSTTEFPSISDPQAMQRFFLQEVQLGEELLATGEMYQGVEHLANAVAVCGQPQQLLQVLQQTLSPNIFQALLQKLPIVSQCQAMLQRRNSMMMTSLLAEERHYQKLASLCLANSGTDIITPQQQEKLELHEPKLAAACPGGTGPTITLAEDDLE